MKPKARPAGLQFHVPMYKSQETTQLPLVLLVAARRAKTMQAAVLCVQVRRARSALCAGAGRGQAVVGKPFCEPEHICRAGIQSVSQCGSTDGVPTAATRRRRNAATILPIGR